MKLLLDTQVMIWMVGESERLRPATRELLLSAKHILRYPVSTIPA